MMEESFEDMLALTHLCLASHKLDIDCVDPELTP